MPIVDSAVYVDGSRLPGPADLDATFARRRETGGLAWVGLLRPTEEELDAVAAEFGLHPVALSHVRSGHERATLQRYGDTVLAVLRPARYVDESETVVFTELHVFAGHGFVVTIRHDEFPELSRVRQRLEEHRGLLARGAEAILHGVIDEVVDRYGPVVAGVENDIDEIEDSLFTETGIDISRRVYKLSGEAIAFQHGTQPLAEMLERLIRGGADEGADPEVQHLLRDVRERVLRLDDRISSFRAVLANALTVNATLVTQRQTETSLTQNEQVKKISGWAAVLFGPTLVGTVYGMNFRHMPELEWPWGYPAALALMAATSIVLYVVFKRKKWM